MGLVSNRKENWLRPPSETSKPHQTRWAPKRGTAATKSRGPSWTSLGLSHPSADRARLPDDQQLEDAFPGNRGRSQAALTAAPALRYHRPPRLTPIAHHQKENEPSLSDARQRSSSPLPDSHCVATGRVSKRHCEGGASSEPCNSAFLSGPEGHQSGPLRKGERRTALSMRRKGSLSWCGTEARVQRSPRVSFPGGSQFRLCHIVTWSCPRRKRGYFGASQ